MHFIKRFGPYKFQFDIAYKQGSLGSTAWFRLVFARNDFQIFRAVVGSMPDYVNPMSNEVIPGGLVLTFRIWNKGFRYQVVNLDGFFKKIDDQIVAPKKQEVLDAFRR